MKTKTLNRTFLIGLLAALALGAGNLFGAPPKEKKCNDGIDNDGDGLVDCDDPDCAGASNCGGGGGGDDDGGAEFIPVCITFANTYEEVEAMGLPGFVAFEPKITSDPLDDPDYCDGDLKNRVGAFVGGNVSPDVIGLDTNTSRKYGSGRQIYFDVAGIGSTDADFVTQRDTQEALGFRLQTMAPGQIKAIGARFVIPDTNDKNRSLLTFGDTAPFHGEPSCEGVPDSNVWVQALSDDDGDGTIDNWLVWADESRQACLTSQPDVFFNAPFAMLVQKQL